MTNKNKAAKAAKVKLAPLPPGDYKIPAHTWHKVVDISTLFGVVQEFCSCGKLVNRSLNDDPNTYALSNHITKKNAKIMRKIHIDLLVQAEVEEQIKALGPVVVAPTLTEFLLKSHPKPEPAPVDPYPLPRRRRLTNKTQSDLQTLVTRVNLVRRGRHSDMEARIKRSDRSAPYTPTQKDWLDFQRELFELYPNMGPAVWELIRNTPNNLEGF